MSPLLRRSLITIIVLVGIGLLLWPKFKPQDEAGGPAAFAPGSSVLTVNAIVAVPQVIRDRILTTGTILPNEVVELATETSGKIVGLFFDEGRSVEKGDLLLKINDSELQAQLRTVESRLALAKEVEERQRALLEKEGLSRAEYDVAVNDLAVQTAALDLIKAQIEKTELRAPFSGLVGLRYVSEGSYVTSGSRIATLQEVNPIKIEFSIPERHAVRAKVGDMILYTVEGYDGEFRGQIYAFEPSIQQDTRSLLLRARSSNPGTRLIPGSFATIEMVFNEIKDAIAVPSVAVIPELGGNRIYVYKSGIVVSKQVTTGIRLEDRVQITSGIAPLDTIITSGIQQIFPGTPVNLSGEVGQ